jgi:hypothetical protein
MQMIDPLFCNLGCRFCDGLNWIFTCNARGKLSLIRRLLALGINAKKPHAFMHHFSLIFILLQAVIFPCVCYLSILHERLTKLQVRIWSLPSRYCLHMNTFISLYGILGAD